jgi:two-component system, sensor histidine kinase and response regulator
MLIYILDDDKGDIKIIRNLLRSTEQHYNIVEASNDTEIAALLEKTSSHPDLIFLDYQIPGKGGMEWLRDLKEKNIAPVVILTGRGDEITAAESIKNGAMDYIPKDKLDVYQLTKTIRNTRERWEIQNERDALIGIAAHELRNPLTVILGYSEILNNYLDLPETQKMEIYSIIYKKAAHLQDIISSILDYSSIEKGKIKINFIECDILPVIKEVVERSKIIANKKNIIIKLESEIDSCSCYFDMMRIDAVLTNFIDNAVKFSPENSQVTVAFKRMEDRISISIKDNGQGIKEEELKFLFSLFSNVKISSRPTAGEKSTGLGLAICKKIIGLHNGTISVKSELGKGSVFTFELPLAESLSYA